MSSSRQQDELSALASIYRADEFSLLGADAGTFYARTRLPPNLVVQSRDGRDSLRHLPPLCLHFSLPPAYPDHGPPDFMLACHWLSRGRLSRLCRRLDELHEPGQEVLFTWFSFLQEEVFSFLGLTDTVSIAAIEELQAPRVVKATRGASDAETIAGVLEARREIEQTGLALDQESEQPKVARDSRGCERNSVPNGSGRETEQSTFCEVKETERSKVAQNSEDRQQSLVTEEQSVLSEERKVASNPGCLEEMGREGWDKQRAVAPGDGRRRVKLAPGPTRRRTRRIPHDSRAVLEADPQGLRLFLLDQAAEQARVEFERSSQECSVCLTDRPGQQSLLMSPCQHVVCTECAMQYLRVAVTRGGAVTCPGHECGSTFPHHLAQSLLPSDEFQRYDASLLESALASLPDIVRCPRPACQYAVTRDGDEKLATCFGCRYAFCVDCLQGYHGVEPCRFRPNETRRLVSEYSEGSVAERHALEKRYGRRRLQGLVDVSLSQAWLEDNSKNCPHCKASIQKAFGCNKMVCGRCGTNFCWLCAERLNPDRPYVHFMSTASPCHNLLFQGIEVAEGDDLEGLDEMEPDELVGMYQMIGDEEFEHWQNDQQL